MKHIYKHRYIYLITLLFFASIVLNELDRTRIIAIITMTTLTILAGFHIFKKALMDLKYHIIGIDLLVTIAVVSAFIIGDYFEAAAVTYLFTLGHVLEKNSLEKTRGALKSLMDLRPKVGRKLTNNQEEIIPIDNLEIGDILLVKPGEMIPTDGMILEGAVYIDEQMMTGESMPVFKTVHQSIYGSTLLKSGYIKMHVTRIGEDTTLSRIIHMVEEAQDKKANTQKFMEKFAKYYTPMVVFVAVLIFILTRDIRLSVTMLVIACPGALVIATPVSFVAGIGNAAKKGILFKGGDAIERLAKSDVVFFDKTGTLTKGKPVLVEIKSYQGSENDVLSIAAAGETYSEHPLAEAILAKAKDNDIIMDAQVKPEIHIGKGIRFEYNEVMYSLGNMKMVAFEIPQGIRDDINAYESKALTTLILSNESEVIALFGIKDTLRPDVKTLIEDLKSMGIQETIMLTGDQALAAQVINEELGLDRYHAGLLPEDKAEVILNYPKGHHTLFVGDGINDALALSYANTSVAVGGLGKDLAMETADVVLMGENILKLKDAILISRKVKTNMLQNITFALVVVAILMAGVLFEKVSMSLGMLVHEVSVLLVLMNAIRLLRYDLGGTREKRIGSR